jgi:phage terminase small subunit
MMTLRQQKFIEHYAQIGNATQSAIAAGYSEKTSKQKGHELKNFFRNEIQEATQKLLADKIPENLQILTELARNATSETVRLSAVRDILDRAGLKPIERIETTSVERMSDEEIQRELNALLKH